MKTEQEIIYLQKSLATSNLKPYKHMKTIVKVTMTDNYSGRSLTFRVTRSKWESALENGMYNWMSNGQRKKAEDFFGKDNAYHTSMEAE